MSKSLIKRFVPFVAALVLGLFVASFFVTVAAPRFNFNRGASSRKVREMRSLQSENQRLREEVRRQKMQIAEMETRRAMDFDDASDAPPLPLAPIAPARTR